MLNKNRSAQQSNFLFYFSLILHYTNVFTIIIADFNVLIIDTDHFYFQKW